MNQSAFPFPCRQQRRRLPLAASGRRIAGETAAGLQRTGGPAGAPVTALARRRRRRHQQQQQQQRQPRPGRAPAAAPSRSDAGSWRNSGGGCWPTTRRPAAAATFRRPAAVPPRPRASTRPTKPRTLSSEESSLRNPRHWKKNALEITETAATNRWIELVNIATRKK